MNLAKKPNSSNTSSTNVLLDKLNRFDGVLRWEYINDGKNPPTYEAHGKPKAVRGCREKLQSIVNDVRDSATLNSEAPLEFQQIHTPLKLEPVILDENSAALVIPAEIAENPEFLTRFKRSMLNTVTVGVRVVPTSEMPIGKAPIQFKNVIGKKPDDHTSRLDGDTGEENGYVR
jgi:hypothetical protein